MTTLKETVRSVIDRWDSSEYAASDLFEELRAALEQPKSKGYTRAQLNEFEQMKDGTWEADRNG
tara:strand:- start:1703 stop:1894 length:192 start_codon:yes stop_codon:yes gene_type:complete